MAAKPITKDSVICIHDAPQHADDIFCVASIQLMYPDITIIRSRKKEDWDKADFLIDVGNEYIPEEGRFDHHQESFTKYHKSPNTFNWERGPKYAAFGLIWEHYGKEIILAVLHKKNILNKLNREITDEDLTFIHTEVESDIVVSVDAIDNGDTKPFRLDNGAYRLPTMSKFIQSLNPCPIVEIDNFKDLFNLSIKMAKIYLERSILKAYTVIVCKGVMLDSLQNNFKDGILVLKQYLPWSPIFRLLREETKLVDMVIYPSSDGWMFQSPYFIVSTDLGRFSKFMPSGERRTQRYPAPKCLRAKSEQELQTITGIKDIVFVHAAGFVGSAKSLEGAIASAKWIINHQDKE